MPDTKLYNLLGVRPNASQTDIKKAYHKLSKAYHPDKNTDKPEMAEQYKEMQYAYSVLSDPEMRERYDRYGMDGISENGMGGPGPDMNDIFGSLFGHGSGFSGMHGFSPFGGMSGHMGGRGGGGGGRYQSKRKGEDMMHPLRVSLEDLYNGKTSKLQLKRSVLCKKCNGKGSKSGREMDCYDCHGRGIKVEIRQMGPGIVTQSQSVCRVCRGEGNVIAEKDKCKGCNGDKTVKEIKILEVNVDKGMKHGQRIPFRGQGEETPNTTPGDVIVVLQEQKHEKFTRKGNNLLMTQKIGLTEALCGFNFTVKQLDGRDLIVHNLPPSVIAPGTVKLIEAEGMPRYRDPFNKGNLLIEFDVVFPQDHFAEAPKLTELETLLPARAKISIPESGENIEDVNMVDFEATRGASGSEAGGGPGSSRGRGGGGGSRGGGQAYMEDSDEDEEDGARGGIGCTQQ